MPVSTKLTQVEQPENALAFSLKGSLAQLGERLICIQEVSGSIPLGSTISTFERCAFFGLTCASLVKAGHCLIPKKSQPTLERLNSF